MQDSKFKLLVVIIFAFLSSCKIKENADLILINGTIYTADSKNSVVQAIAVKEGKIVAAGSNINIQGLAGDQTQIIDLAGDFLMPGLIDAHAHFTSLGKSLININLLDSKNWEEIVSLVEQKAKETPKAEWIEGRGWHQDKWNSNTDLRFDGYPYHDLLSAVSPDHPVVLTHASGHALIANSKAMEMANISAETASPSGGRIVKDANNRLTGVFEENAMDLITNALNSKTLSKEKSLQRTKNYALKAQQEALQYGITCLQDAGADFQLLEELHQLILDSSIKIRIEAMLFDNNDRLLKEINRLPFPTQKPDFFNARQVKLYLDGALGSYGAWLLQAYSDNPKMLGQNTLPLTTLDSVIKACKAKQLQLCVHAIGDRGNREVLDYIEKNQVPPQLRWRIEHAQHIDSMDIPRFAKLGVIASVQTLHCTSDAPFVIKRLGRSRGAKTSYRWRDLLNADAKIANGTDAPVEKINPFENLYAAVTRKRLDNGLEFFPEQKMTRIEALRAYTIWNAYAMNREKDLGSLEFNKWADFIILDHNLLSCEDSEIPKTKVKACFIAGKKMN
ncbi:MAG TPA: amidohydrolase [Saprospiraceae bacterium]|nr:amidohydrolase [Saprospiraceae bacterium]